MVSLSVFIRTSTSSDELDHLDPIVVPQPLPREILAAGDPAVDLHRHAPGSQADRLEQRQDRGPRGGLAPYAVENDGHRPPVDQPAALRADFLISCLISALSLPAEAWMIRAAVPSSRSGRAQDRDTSPASPVFPSTRVRGLST